MTSAWQSNASWLIYRAMPLTSQLTLAGRVRIQGNCWKSPRHKCLKCFKFHHSSIQGRAGNSVKAGTGKLRLSLQTAASPLPCPPSAARRLLSKPQQCIDTEKWGSTALWNAPRNHLLVWNLSHDFVLLNIFDRVWFCYRWKIIPISLSEITEQLQL